MSDVAISKLSARGSVVFTLMTCVMIVFTNPKDFLQTFGWRLVMKALLLVLVAPIAAYVWHAHAGGPWYGLPLCMVLLYATVLWSLFTQATYTEAERDAHYYKGAWERATENWQECERRVHALKHPPAPPADPDQLALALPEVPRLRRERRGPCRLRCNERPQEMTPAAFLHEPETPV